MANAQLKAPKGMTSVSIDGQEIEVVRGYVSVPAELIAELIGHGEVIDEKEELGTAQDSDNEQASE